MNARAFCLRIAVSAAVVATAPSVIAAQSASRMIEGREQTADQQVLHVLNRLGFGPRPGDVAKVRSMGVDAWIEQQLRPDRIDDAETTRFVADQYPMLAKTAGDLYREFPPQNVQRAQARLRGDSSRRPTMEDSLAAVATLRRSNQFVAQLTSSKVARATMSERQLEEVMVDFWSNHFNVFAGKGQTRFYLTDYDRTVIRPHAMGKFRDLLGAVAKSPAMLFYLDNSQSIADSGRSTLEGRGGGAGRGNRALDNRRRQLAAARGRDTMQALPQRRPRGLNENYARELLELHTLGVDGGYTQKDVIEVARALTGWTIASPRLEAVDPTMARRARQAGMEPGAFVFRPQVHDAEQKVVLGRSLKAGRGIEDGEDVLDIVSKHPSTAKYVARKLVVRFVSDVPPQTLVDRAAATFTRTDGDIREVVRTIVTSPEFFSSTAYRSKVKSPFEVVVSALRAMNAAPDPTPRTAQIVAQLGQQIYGHQAPNGWPETGDAWMNTGAILNRINFGLTMAAGRVPGVTLSRWPSTATLRDAPRDRQVDGVVSALLGGAISTDTRAVLTSGENPLLSSGAPDTTMRTMTDNTQPMRERRRQQGRGANFSDIPPLTGLAQVVGLALGSPEFQRR
jgi:uncharacterized protein (DUF1800 family)